MSFRSITKVFYDDRRNCFPAILLTNAVTNEQYLLDITGSFNTHDRVHSLQLLHIAASSL